MFALWDPENPLGPGKFHVGVLVKYSIRSRRNVIEAKSFRDTGHCKDIESTGNLGPIAGF